MVETIEQSEEWTLLKKEVETIKYTHLRELLKDSKRNEQLTAEFEGIYLDYSRQNVTQTTMEKLFALANRASLKEKQNNMFNGTRINETENRSVLHTVLRSPKSASLIVEGVDVVKQVHEVLESIKIFSERVRNGVHKGVTDKSIVNVISVGIGGSYLGPEFVYEALRSESEASKSSKGRKLRFLANVDPTDVARSIENLCAEETMVVIVSKTFTTAETILNAKTLRDWLINNLKHKCKVSENEIIKRHMIAVSSDCQKVVSFGIDKENIFGFWDWVGGRYSVCSSVGIVPLSLHYGFYICEKFLAGAHSVDQHFLSAPYYQNIPIIMGLLGIWNSSFLGHSCRALLPYSQALIRFSAHIQQVDMESNGKRVDMKGRELTFPAGEIDFGEPGTNGQHSFYQLIHQGRVIPCDFIGFRQSQNPISIEGEIVSNHDELMSNFFAQPDALAKGKTLEELKKDGVPPNLQPHKTFTGNRPSLSLLFDKLDAYTCGQLLAIYEHRTFVQGAIWGINSFDQWGVELGKQLATKVRKQLADCRLNTKLIAKDVEFNSSTINLINRYLGFN